MLTSWTVRAQLGQFKSSSQVPRGKPGFYYSHYSHLLFCFLFFSRYLDMSGGQESERLGVPALGSCSTPRYSANFLLTALFLPFHNEAVAPACTFGPESHNQSTSSLACTRSATFSVQSHTTLPNHLKFSQEQPGQDVF